MLRLKEPSVAVTRQTLADFGLQDNSPLDDAYVPLLGFHAILAQNFHPGHPKAAVAANLRDNLVELYQLIKAETEANLNA